MEFNSFHDRVIQGWRFKIIESILFIITRLPEFNLWIKMKCIVNAVYGIIIFFFFNKLNIEIEICKFDWKILEENRNQIFKKLEENIKHS